MSQRLRRAIPTIVSRPDRFAWTLLLTWGAVLPAPPLTAPAWAGTEEFSTFSVEAQDADDESLIDHVLTRPPHVWASEWERAPQALRSSQGCLTSEQWFNETALKLRAPLGRRSHFGFDLQQSENDRSRYEYLDFSFHVATRVGTAGAMFRPYFDKARQDFAAMWDVGSDSSAVQLRLVAGFEDLFNNIWEFRQSRVGGRAEPYLRHPYEPALRLVVRQPGLRAELGGRYLTPSRKRIVISSDASLDRVRTLWGAYAWASVEAEALGIAWEVRSTNHQASGTDALLLQPLPDARDYRRQWSVETAARRRFGERLVAETRWIYQGRDQVHGPPLGPRTFEAVDRVIQLDALWSGSSRFAVRAGGLHDRITVTQAGNWPSVPYNSHGSRSENRVYLGVIARLGRVSLQAIEGFELDHEPYEVTWIHDKGFLQLQTTF